MAGLPGRAASQKRVRSSIPMNQNCLTRPRLVTHHYAFEFPAALAVAQGGQQLRFRGRRTPPAQV